MLRVVGVSVFFMVRTVVLLSLLMPAIASAEDVEAVPPPPSRFSIGFKIIVAFPSVSFGATQQPHEFGSVQQYTPSFELDVPATFRVLPWLRAEAAAGFTEQQINWNPCPSGTPCLASVSQDAFVAAVGAQAFRRLGSWEGYVDLTFRVPIQIQTAHATFQAESGDYNGPLSGGETIAIAAGVARRADTVRFFAEVGYLQSIVTLDASAVGLSASFGGALFATGISLW